MAPGQTTAIPSHSLASIRTATPELLGLALMDARNQTLALLARWDEAQSGQGVQVPSDPQFELPQWLAGHIAWFAESWIVRNPRRGLGRSCPSDAPRLPSVEPMADRWYQPMLAPHDARWEMPIPGLQDVRAYMLDTLERTLDLLDRAVADDDGLFFFRAALFHEDLRGEQLLRQAQALGIAMPLRLRPASAPREPLLLPATRWTLGAHEAGFAFDVEQGPHEVAVPEFEIDAQPVSWEQYVEFVDDGGYDRDELWLPEGWAWLQKLGRTEGRRGPRHVEQLGSGGGAVLQTLFGRPTRMAGQQAALHVSWWEADAYARWAGRRLPTEVEWEVAAQQAAGRGFRWGEVWEWTAGTLRPWPGFTPDPWARHAEYDATAVFGQARVLRGASFATRSRLRWVRRRSWALPGRDDHFVGFRTCAV